MLIMWKNAICFKSLKSVAQMSTAAIQSKKINVEGQIINYVQVGNGEKKVLCFPGALGSIWSDFKPQIENFDRNKLTVVAWDPPGYGNSRPPNKNFSVKFYEEDADCAQKFMAKIGINKYTVLGWSDGGISGMIMASKYPKSVEKLVIWGSNSYFVEEEVQVCESLRDISKWSTNMKTPLIALYTEKGLKDMWSAWCDTILKIYENGGDVCSNKLKDIKCPVFILHGDKDRMVASEHHGYLLSNIKGAKLHKYPDGKHNIHLKYSEDFNKRVTEFILQ